MCIRDRYNTHPWLSKQFYGKKKCVLYSKFYGRLSYTADDKQLCNMNDYDVSNVTLNLNQLTNFCITARLSLPYLQDWHKKLRWESVAIWEIFSSSEFWVLWHQVSSVWMLWGVLFTWHLVAVEDGDERHCNDKERLPDARRLFPTFVRHTVASDDCTEFFTDERWC